jgi:hypothetical protein
MFDASHDWIRSTEPLFSAPALAQTSEMFRLVRAPS